ncbi:MAG: hypothetical protein K2X55_02360 [Burkholderiaceae bacterium]|nr:hypothetical protein [Burkholderiaceae bacterium]
MALIVEDGTGRTDAESYCSVADADRYHRAVGKEADWVDLDTDVKEQKLREATRFMRQAYRPRWAGARVNSSQALCWPRYGVYVDKFTVASNVVPNDVRDACAELALRAAGGDGLLPDLETGSNQVKVEKIGPLTTEFFEANVDAAARFPAVDAILQPYFAASGSSGMMKVVRA